MKFIGFYFNSECEPKKCPTEIEFTAQQVKLYPKNENAPIVWEQSKLTSYCGGSNNHLYFFHRQNESNPSFYIERNREIDQFLLKNSNPLLNKAVKNRKMKRNITGSFLFALVGILIASIFTLYSFKDDAIGYLVNKIPYETEKQLGDALFKNMKSQFNFVDDEDVLEGYKEIASLSLKNLEEPYDDIKLYIIKGKQVNAFAMPGGHVVFFEGALKKFKNYSEFTGVLQHEIAHVRLRHSLKNILSSVSTYLLVSVFLGDATGLLAVLADQGSFLLQQSYSREFELEADNFAFDELVGLKVDPRGMVGFFKSLLEKSNSELEKSLEWISTHPATQTRIDNILTRYDKEIDKNLQSQLVVDTNKFKEWQNKYYPLEKEVK